MGRDSLERFQHKAPLGNAGMRQRQRIRVAIKPGIIEQIQIQGACCIRGGTLALESRFDFVQKCQQSKGLKLGRDSSHRIQERRVGGIGPGLGFIEGRDGENFDTPRGPRRPAPHVNVLAGSPARDGILAPRAMKIWPPEA